MRELGKIAYHEHRTYVKKLLVMPLLTPAAAQLTKAEHILIWQYSSLFCRTDVFVCVV